MWNTTIYVCLFVHSFCWWTRLCASTQIVSDLSSLFVITLCVGTMITYTRTLSLHIHAIRLSCCHLSCCCSQRIFFPFRSLRFVLAQYFFIGWCHCDRITISTQKHSHNCTRHKCVRMDDGVQSEIIPFRHMWSWKLIQTRQKREKSHKSLGGCRKFPTVDDQAIRLFTTIDSITFRDSFCCFTSFILKSKYGHIRCQVPQLAYKSKAADCMRNHDRFSKNIFRTPFPILKSSCVSMICPPNIGVGFWRCRLNVQEEMRGRNKEEKKRLVDSKLFGELAILAYFVFIVPQFRVIETTRCESWCVSRMRMYKREMLTTTSWSVNWMFAVMIKSIRWQLINGWLGTHKKRNSDHFNLILTVVNRVMIARECRRWRERAFVWNSPWNAFEVSLF